MKKKKNTCKHSNFYRFWYSEDHLINVCRDCPHEWEENYRPFLLGDLHELTEGSYAETPKDTEVRAKRNKEIREKAEYERLHKVYGKKDRKKISTA